MTDAVKEAKRKLKDPTSHDEDAALLAEMIHGLGIQAKNAGYDRIRNGKTEEDPYLQVFRLPDGSMKFIYEPDSEGEATDEDGNNVQSYRQFIADCERRVGDLWQTAREEENVRDVEEQLEDVQKAWLEQLGRRRRNGSE